MPALSRPAVLPPGAVPGYDQAVLVMGPASVRHAPDATAQVVATLAVPVPADRQPRNTIVLDLSNLADSFRGGHGQAPLFVLAPAGGGWQPYTLVSFTGTDALFIALDGPPTEGDPGDSRVVNAWVADLSARHRAHAARLNNHRRWFVNARPGLEIEQKFTLAGRPDIWLLAARTRDLVAAGAIDGWVPEHGSDGGFEQWDFPSHIYEIAAPEPERGYIAFIPAVDGSWGIRRKWFTADAIIRREQLTGGLDLGADPDLRAVIRDRYGLAPSWGGCYRRVRYNVLLESLRSGHVFSVMFDRCTDATGLAPDLHQAEVEYIRSRVIRTRPGDDLMGEFGQLCDWTRRLLDGYGVHAEQGNLSKLTWLRQAAQDRPPQHPLSASGRQVARSGLPGPGRCGGTCLYRGLVTSTGLDQRTLEALLADARAAVTAYDDALAWLEIAVKGPMEPVAAEVWAFDESFTRVLLVRHRWRGWVPPGGRVEAGETPREAARREFREETGLDGRLLEAPAAVTVRTYREDWTPTLGLSYAAVLDGSLVPAGESRQPAAWTPLSSDWEGAFPDDRPRIRAFAGHLKAARRPAAP